MLSSNLNLFLHQIMTHQPIHFKENMNSQVDIGKKAAAKAAVELIQPGMQLGLGTGSTIKFFIEQLAERCHHGLTISAVSTSEQSTILAQSLGIPLVDINELTSLDLAIDGADQIDS